MPCSNCTKQIFPQPILQILNKLLPQATAARAKLLGPAREPSWAQLLVEGDALLRERRLCTDLLEQSTCLRSRSEIAEALQSQDCSAWPPWSCRSLDALPGNSLRHKPRSILIASSERSWACRLLVQSEKNTQETTETLARDAIQ